MIYRKTVGTFLETVIDDETVLMNLGSGQFDALKGTARAIWAEIDGVRDLDAISAALSQNYAVDSIVCAQEVTAFVTALERRGYVTA